jgi:ParB family chromosome partitioning protein
MKKALGRGLDALLGADEEAPTANKKDMLATLPVAQLQRGKYQPRTRMDEASLVELAESIKGQGVMQPILVRAVAAQRYEIIAGERRWRAAQIAGLAEVPVVIRDVPDKSALAMALIENIQRENLNPLEEAAGIQRLLNEFQLTHEQAAQVLGRSRAATTNLLRLLSLSKPVQDMVFEGALDMGHARALLALDPGRQLEAAKRVAAGGLSVRDTERLVHALLHPPAARKKPALRNARDIERFEEELSERLGTTVEIKTGKKGSGKLLISYASAEHLDDLLSKFKG